MIKTVEEMKRLFPWEEGMKEISGMSGSYEQACRDMVYAGLVWLENKPHAQLKAVEYKNIFGSLESTSPDAQELENAMVNACPDCTGAMHHAAMSHCMYIAKNGWAAYVQEMRKNE